MPQANRASSGYLLKTGKSLSLIDCGGGVTSSFLRRGFDALDIDRIFISHTHPDHVTELPFVIQLIHLNQRTEPLDVYLPADFVAPFRQFLQALYIIEERLPFPLNIVGYEIGFEYDNEFKLAAIGNKHLHAYSQIVGELDLPNKMQCCSFDMKIGDKTVFYSSDIATNDDVRPNLDGKDLVLLESTHIDLAEFVKHASTISVGRFVITHLGTQREVVEIHRMA
ncbi:MAG: ribonuclease Z, partial [Candidatus Zixiibacteriota bacterium]